MPDTLFSLSVPDADPAPHTPHRSPSARSARREIRNPVFALPTASKIMELPHAHRQLLGSLLRELAEQASEKAEAAWQKRKGPMAAYHRATSSYARHIARVINPR